ncbi:hypothetical protein Tco_0781404 [Tanacetum coccineum]
MEQMTSICDMVGQYMQKKEEEKRIAEEQAAKDRYWNIPICYDDDDDEESSIPLKDIIISGLPPCVAITPVLLTEEPVDSLITEDEHLDTIPVTESDEVIKSSVKNLVPIPSESKGIPDSVCDMPLCNNHTPLGDFKEHSEIVVDFNDDSTSSDDDSPYEGVEIVVPEVGGIDTDILLTIKDEILREKLLNINLLIAKIEALKDNPTPSSDAVTKSSSTSLNLFLEETNTFDNSLTESETFAFDLEENSSGSTTTRSDYSLPDYEAFYVIVSPIREISLWMLGGGYDIFPTREPRVHVPNVLPTHPTLHLDLDFTLFSDSIRSNLVVFFPFGTRNKIFDPGIFIEVQSKRFLLLNEFSISFIRDPLSPVFDTLLPFSSENEDNVFNPVNNLLTSQLKSGLETLNETRFEF